MTSSDVTMEDLLARVEALEVARHYPIKPSLPSRDTKKKKKDDSTPVTQQKHVVVDESMRRARLAVEACPAYSAQWAVVPQPDYYTWSLEDRAKYLGAPSIHHLCKTLLMENKKHCSCSLSNDDGSTTSPYDPTNPRFFLVVLQYAATLDVPKTINLLRSLRPVGERLDANHYDLRIASSDDNDAMTGYSHNSVTPFGLSHSDRILVLLTDAVMPLHYVWMGGGAVHVKLRVAVSEFCKVLPHVVVGDISKPRSGIVHVSDLND